MIYLWVEGVGSRSIKDIDLICEHDYCDECGDCLICFGEDPCCFDPNGDHILTLTEKEYLERKKAC